MSVPAPPRAVSPLGLPAAALHDRAHAEPHPDSEVAVRYERQRYSQELGPVRRERTTTLNEPRAIPSLNSIRSRNALLRSSTNDSTEDLRRHASDISITSAQVNVYQEGPGRDEVARTERWYDPVVKLWAAHVSLSIDEGAHRDHLALERTFLGYLRTSLILVMTGVLTAQLFHLQHSATPNPHFGFYKVGKPLAATLICMAIVVVLVGAIRFWRLQRALVRGKAMAGGWEVGLVMVLMICLLLVTFAVVVGVDIEKTYFGNE
ncbi:unnamed protein product [Alternaria alternata]|uniref:DUF202 domain-containing protein n=2 Tax=Alternaria alternata complex TaxID=187734 RepID=A0AB37WP18_9PLEO|nr:hypothetical protein AA0115_g3253 [Alternaria tenuissima]RYO15255.1 hypothetical protein AA0121_g7081 [Alternaria tenuissima]